MSIPKKQPVILNVDQITFLSLHSGISEDFTPSKNDIISKPTVDHLIHSVETKKMKQENEME